MFRFSHFLRGLMMCRITTILWILERNLRQAYRTMHVHMNVAGDRIRREAAKKIMRRAFTSRDSPTLRVITTDGPMYLLFSGGRTQGKTGTAGTGAIVIRKDPGSSTYIAVWGSYMSYADTKLTNATAAHMALLTGLKECASKRYRPLHVEGDYDQLIRQHSRRKPPQVAHLKALYWRCRRFADTVKVIKWHHHPRENNKMVSELAGTAISTCSSRQSTILRTEDMRRQ
ncbi:hypothetical protein PF008_g15613 [Phytophthora fragariae]|uniref:RNase H type-1 domain-containing protein n=1 Tax=Phytophthora fragariae TaxID=53985 RepID=A0A6G0RDR7_9STRA|nr:hypothetical protein PF008_g15613 [Phytophthora fragariae]